MPHDISCVWGLPLTGDSNLIWGKKWNWEEKSIWGMGESDLQCGENKALETGKMLGGD